MNKLFIHSWQKTRRLSYVVDFYNAQIDGFQFEIKVDGDQAEGNYTVTDENSPSNKIEIPSEKILTEGQNIKQFSGFEASLKLDGSRFNFDFLSATFFLLTRAEEYNSDLLDKHGRYQHQNSILYKKGLIEKPVIDYWINDLLKILNKRFGLNGFRKQQYIFDSTLDIDHIYAFKHKPLTIFFGGMFRDILKGKWKKVGARFWKKDPFDTFDEIVNKHNDLDIDLKVFILCTSRSRFDKSLPPENKEFIYKVQKLSDKYEIGIHPSYKSDSEIDKVDLELKLLESITAKPIENSRFHYVRIKWPQSYRTLLQLGIKHDYTMGYPDVLGFRAGTSLPFFWYDLERDQQTSLTVHPFQIMDVTLRKYLGLDTEGAIRKASEIIDTIKAAGGCCCLIWHNSSFFGLEGWAGWKEVYDAILRKGKA